MKMSSLVKEEDSALGGRKEAMGLRPGGLKDGVAVLREQSEVKGPAQGLAREYLCCCCYL